MSRGGRNGGLSGTPHTKSQISQGFRVTTSATWLFSCHLAVASNRFLVARVALCAVDRVGVVRLFALVVSLIMDCSVRRRWFVLVRWGSVFGSNGLMVVSCSAHGGVLHVGTRESLQPSSLHARTCRAQVGCDWSTSPPQGELDVVGSASTFGNKLR